ncbi:MULTISPECIES: cytidylate kinase family protein [Streptomyces]|uniref:Cytidylate kinase-like family protein n=1 Tax=Streptomyces cadmiisoli TaxID=2184053 RepID=A0A2Z4IYD0_9ACTN|nr:MULTISPECIES: cytidylate kinase family protein [Streptomyces]AWW37787.1 cytidylate kinase-like family protein [Streptomyces cadmiisoli]
MRKVAEALSPATGDHRNIIVSGLTAAGKTTHALLIAKWLGYDYVSASELMLRLLKVQPDMDNTLWATSLSTIERLRNQYPADEEVNRLLIAEAQRRTSTVFDSWSLPWLIDDIPCVRLYIESDLRSRSLKVRVSQQPHAVRRSLEECTALAEEKDRTTAVRLQPLLGVDIRTDRSVFDAVLDNSAYIDEPTIEAARAGISAFHASIQRTLCRLRADPAAAPDNTHRTGPLPQ